ncbi:MAG: alanine racemase [Acidimicrobiaceae bacterium]|jgi:alanine racemase|nr:alanine racemase [Acidimicrobiaceae bacterium]
MREAVARPAWAEVDLDAVRHNAGVLAQAAHPAELCAVVKANGYGLGAEAVAGAALAGGATRLAVALVDEGVALREAGVEGPILLLSEPPPEAMADAVAHHLTPTLYTAAGVDAAAAAVGHRRPIDVELKVDTGMHRVGAALDHAVAVAESIHGAPGLRLAGLWTHLAVADEPANPYTAMQLERFEQARDRLARAGIVPDHVHAANSAGAVAHPAARYDMVRCGIALYGYDPSPALAGVVDLRPALTLRARVSHVKELDAGERMSYGLRYAAPERTVIATVPLGYADGVPRRLFDVGVPVLVGGGRRPIAGAVTMDQLLVDCGPGADVAVGDDVVLIGRQGTEAITADEWAAALGTINYEVLCGIGPRVPRVYVGEDAAAAGSGPAEVRQGVL